MFSPSAPGYKGKPCAVSSAIASLGVRDRLALVLSNGALPVPVEPSVSVMELVQGTVLSWARPRDWERSSEAIDALLDQLAEL